MPSRQGCSRFANVVNVDGNNDRKMDAGDEPAIVAAFLARYLEDRAVGAVTTLADYEARYPGFEDAIAREYRALQEQDGETVRSLGTPARIGPFRILKTLGEGGMGVVYLADQERPVQRRVALKVVKPGRDTGEVLQRFEIERQTLARMDHPNIATIYDVGTTELGHPYFAMEYVAGDPLTVHCDARRLTVGERLDLFLGVCDAVQHAHQRAALHRDLKPSNVLVTQLDGRAVPKVIDFGLAKALESDAEAGAELTQAGDFLGTVAYASPEQVSGAGTDLDTRSDVYSLGVMLYELLTGTLPFEEPSSRGSGPLDYARRLRETDPPKPSTRLTCLNGDGAKIARQRGTDTRALARRVRNDLDWITLEALERDRERRYPSVAALAADIRRHLAHEPVLAGPPTTAYRVRKFVRRRRGLVAGLGAVTVLLIGGSVVATRFALAAEANLTDFNRLAFVSRLDAANAKERELYPAWPTKADTIREWLRKDAEPLLAALDELRAAIAALEAVALPRTAAESAEERRTHPRAEELAAKRGRLAALRRAHAVRDGRLRPEPFQLDPAKVPEFSAAINSAAWELVRPDRRIFGREAEGIALARLALTMPDARRREVLDTLAWGLLANGLDDEALDASRGALATVRSENLREDFERLYRQNLDRIQAAIAAAAGEAAARQIAAFETDIAELEVEVARRRHFRFDDPATTFLHRTLSSLVDRIVTFEQNQVAAARQRLEWATRIEELSITRHEERWNEARSAIRAANGVAASELYAAVPIDLDPQFGLVPIGMNPRTRLWEFHHLRSAWDSTGQESPATLQVPEHREDGSLDMAGKGLVFVLIPGGPSWIGAQQHSREGPNYDPDGRPAEEPVREVRLAPFFLSKYEMTQRQWACLTDGEYPSWHRIGKRYGDDPGTTEDSHPVENVSHAACADLLRRHGLALPTEAQWECGCRAGTATPWSTGGEPVTLQGYANVRDRSFVASMAPGEKVEGGIDDGYPGVAPVGYFQPNPFGLYDMHGNVGEWCRDRYGNYYLTRFRSGDGLLIGPTTDRRVVRGGGHQHQPRHVRSADRVPHTPTYRFGTVGVRPARPLLRRRPGQ